MKRRTLHSISINNNDNHATARVCLWGCRR
jgi:hypothetical protein